MMTLSSTPVHAGSFLDRAEVIREGQDSNEIRARDRIDRGLRMSAIGSLLRLRMKIDEAIEKLASGHSVPVQDVRVDVMSANELTSVVFCDESWNDWMNDILRGDRQTISEFRMDEVRDSFMQDIASVRSVG